MKRKNGSAGDQRCLDSKLPGRRSKWLVPAFAACLGAVPLTETWGQDDAVAAENVQVSTEEGLAWLSGGIGDEARQAMRAAAKDYNVHVLFSDRQGSYLADIPFRVLSVAGEVLATGKSDGPMLYLRLPPGSFRISVELDGAWQSRSVRVLPKGHPVSVIFLGRGDTP